MDPKETKVHQRHCTVVNAIVNIKTVYNTREVNTVGPVLVEISCDKHLRSCQVKAPLVLANPSEEYKKCLLNPNNRVGF